jgi:hypothetical protein
MNKHDNTPSAELEKKLKFMGYMPDVVCRVVDIFNLVNKLPITNNTDRDVIFTDLLKIYLTDNINEQYIAPQPEPEPEPESKQ